MEKIYYELVKAGNRTIKQVPVNLRSVVQQMLDADTEKVNNNVSN